MHLKQSKNNIYCFFMILLLIYGMCTGSSRADSSFLCTYSVKASPEQGAVSHVSTIHRVSSSARSELLYASESLGHCDTALTTLRHPSRRSGIRMSKSDSFSCLSAGLLPRLFPGLSSGSTPCFCQEVISNTIIINYIHHQDGEKVSSPYSQMLA